LIGRRIDEIKVDISTYCTVFTLHSWYIFNVPYV